MKARNQVISGYLWGARYGYYEDRLILNGGNTVEISRTNISRYEVINGYNAGKSASSAIGRAAVGTAILGPVGALAGLTGRNNEIYQVKIYWTNGENSLIEMDGKRFQYLMQTIY